ncbi:unnamed protein product, partial [Allacma fusca]
PQIRVKPGNQSETGMKVSYKNCRKKENEDEDEFKCLNKL